MSRASRIALYLREMSPPQVVIPVGLLKFAVMYFALQGLAGIAPLRLPPRAWLGGLTVGLVMLLLRVYDELKDVESDLRLGKAGDPRYANRPVVRGAVQVADIVFLRNGLTALLVALNLASWDWVQIGSFVGLFAMVWLSSVFFFWPRIRESLALALLTHNPLTLVLSLYAVGVFASSFSLASVASGGMVVLLLAAWLPVTAWETSRKVRIPEDETDYETYSKLWGWKVAALVPAVLVLISAGLLGVLGFRLELPGWYFIGLGLAAAIPVVACVWFRFSPSTRRSKLQPYTEAFAGLSDVLLVAALIASRGVAL